MKKFLLIPTLILCITQLVCGQNPFITNYTIADGLPTNKVFCVLQDKNDFMWFGTSAGVVRFDGTSYTRYTTKDGMSYNRIARMKEDMEGRIWCMNIDGSVNFILNDKIYNEKNAPFLSEIKTDFYYHDLFQDKDSTIYLFNGTGEVAVIKGNSFIDYLPSSLNGAVIFNITRNTNNNLLFWDSNRIVEKSSVDELLENHPLDFNVTRVTLSPEGVTYVCDIDGNIHLFQGSRLISKNYVHIDAQVVNDMLVKDEFLWVSTFDNGLYCFKNDSLVFHHAMKKIQNLVLDAQNNLWTASTTYGIFKINDGILKYQTIEAEQFDEKGVRAIAPSNDDFLWLTNGESLFIFKDGKLFDNKLDIGEYILDQIIQLSDNSLLISGINTQLYIYKNLRINPKNNTIEYDNLNKSNIHVRKPVVDSSESKVNFYLNDNLFFRELKGNYPQFRVKYTNWGRIRNIFLNYNNDLIVNGNTNHVVAGGQISTDSTYSVFDGKWIASNITIDSTTEVLQIEEADNSELVLIHNDSIFSLIDNMEDHISLKIKDMIYYDKTVFLYNQQTVYFISNPTDVIKGETAVLNRLNITFNNINDLYCQNEILYVASDDGLTLIPVSECVNAVSIPTKPYFSKVTLDEKEMALAKGEIVYKNKDRLSIEFSSLNFSSSPSNFAYMLEGVNNDWITGTEKQVVYLNLKPGHYTFKLKSRKNMEPYSEVIELPVTIIPTFFQRVSTRIGALLLLLFLGFLMVRNYYRRQLREREKDNQLVTLENRALQSMMNPHFIFNSLGSIQKFLLQNKSEEAGAYLSRFARLIRQTMNSIKSNSVLLDDEVERLRNYIELEQFRMENHFEFSVILDDQLQQDDYNIPSMIVQPFVENAIWHGISQLQGKGKITIRFNYVNEKSIRIIIEDNGIGFEKSKAFSKTKSHLNMASNLTQKRIQLIGEKYQVKTQLSYEELYPGETNPGAKITLLVPIVE
ncbi:sensor histidine kinase [Draconibacterium sediminis]|uniref:sensor histidine kinase n=1 Tax=Draconibacterium sediminis TaxID=1544798 RepID=UPI0026EE8B62|nr:sensor histidine kinase [Draconibacterium sediminis]